MIDFIPVQYRLFAFLIAMVVAGALGAAGGAKVATWKADSTCSEAKADLNEKITTLTTENVALKVAIVEANHAIELAKAQSDAIEMAQLEAERAAALTAKSSQERLDRLKSEYAKATSAGDILHSYWNERK
jgi:hypothetical protein